ncbi:MAG: MFS transporter [Rhodopila sp.]
MVGSFWQFVGARVFLGLGEAQQFSGLVRVVRDWYNVRERGLPTGIGLCGSKLGPAIVLLILTTLMLSFGWRWMFVFMGVFGIGVSLVWYAVYGEPGDVDLTADEKAYLSDGEAATTADRVTWGDWKHLFAYRATWGMVLGFFGEVYMGWVHQSWLPGYLEIERHMSIPKTGSRAFRSRSVSSAASERAGLTDALSRRGVSPLNSCKIAVMTGLAGMAGFSIVAALTPFELTSVVQMY